MSERLYPFIGGIVRDQRGSLLAIGGMSDHIHLLVRWGTDASIGDLVRHAKSRSSAWVHREFDREFAWQEGYGVFSVSASNRAEVERYIGAQAEHHRVWSFKEELEMLLRKHRVEFSPADLD